MFLDAVDTAAEVDELRVLGAREFPRVAVLEPAVRLLDLLPVDDALAEDAVVVAEAVAHAREVERTHRVEEARGEAPKSAVSEPGVHLEVAQGVPVDAVLLQRLGTLAVELEVHDIVAEEAADEEFKGQIVDAALVLRVVALLRVDPPLHDAVADRVRERRVLVARRRRAVVLHEGVAEMPGKVLFQTLHRVFDPAVLRLLRHVRLFCLVLVKRLLFYQIRPLDLNLNHGPGARAGAQSPTPPSSA